MAKKLLSMLLVACMMLTLGMPEKAKADVTTQKTLELNKAYTEVWQEYETKLYKFTVPQAGIIDISIKNTNPTGTEEVEASLYDSNNAQVLATYDGPNVTLPTYATNANATYYLKVTDDNSAWQSSFVVTIKFTATTNWETEKNDTAATADVISLQKTYYGMINSDFDEGDYYKFTVPGNRKVTVKFGPAMVDGESREWDVYLMNSKNQSVHILRTGTTQPYVTYLKKGTYYLKVENEYSAKNIKYAVTVTAKTFKLKQPKIKSINGTASKGFFEPNYVQLNNIRIKNSGVCQGYHILVARKKNMKGRIANETLDFGDSVSKGKISLGNHLGVYRKYYVKLRGYVKDPFENKIYGKYSKVKCKTMKKKVYKDFKN